MLSTKREGKSYTKVTRFYFRACSPLSIRVRQQHTYDTLPPRCLFFIASDISVNTYRNTLL